MIRTRVSRLVALVLLIALPVVAGVEDQVRRYDLNHDGYLDKPELTAYFLERDPIIQKSRTDGATPQALQQQAMEIAIDAITSRCDTCTTISISNAVLFIDQRLALVVIDKKLFGWPGLQFRRYVTDNPDPRQGRNKLPMIFSYRHDSQSSHADQLSILGGIQLSKTTWSFDPDQRKTITFTPGIDADIDTTKKPSDSTIQLGIPVGYEWVSTSPSSTISDVAVTLTPRYTTDRRLARDVYELTLNVSITSPRLLRMGYTTDIGRAETPAIQVAWLPNVQLETGRIQDAGGNAKLEVLKRNGTYLRIAPHLNVMLRPPTISTRLSLSADETLRYDLREHWGRLYGTEQVAYDLTPKKNVMFTIVYQHGRKPPDFAPIKNVLVGIGILQ